MIAVLDGREGGGRRRGGGVMCEITSYGPLKQPSGEVYISDTSGDTHQARVFLLTSLQATQPSLPLCGVGAGPQRVQH